jgi:hypothetical protein
MKMSSVPYVIRIYIGSAVILFLIPVPTLFLIGYLNILNLLNFYDFRSKAIPTRVETWHWQ